jgi:hypothetical protein
VPLNQQMVICTFLCGNGNDNHRLEIGFSYIRAAVKRVKFASCSITYVPERGSWCDIIVLEYTYSY